ncbi:hypothetical protein NQ317_005370 [Molorchus minor]|uniref:Uncharacterized protein n=1 Tax=Molorchus minor TaxID=1323400 RepID=A0ABQ9J6S6_9CUCU|nr:hypothetical protein NQ317_005370 [Molorchus minor]
MSVFHWPTSSVLYLWRHLASFFETIITTHTRSGWIVALFMKIRIVIQRMISTVPNGEGISFRDKIQGKYILHLVNHYATVACQRLERIGCGGKRSARRPQMDEIESARKQIFQASLFWEYSTRGNATTG